MVLMSSPFEWHCMSPLIESFVKRLISLLFHSPRESWKCNEFPVEMREMYKNALGRFCKKKCKLLDNAIQCLTKRLKSTFLERINDIERPFPSRFCFPKMLILEFVVIVQPQKHIFHCISRIKKSCWVFSWTKFLASRGMKKFWLL